MEYLFQINLSLINFKPNYMKKIYLFIFSLFALTQLNAQTSYTLTQANSEAVVGDSYASKGVDTSSALPMNLTGLNITWNMTGLYDTLAVDTNKYLSPASDPNSVNYPGVTMVLKNSNGSTYYKSSTNQLEILGADLAFGNNTATLDYNVSSAIVAQYDMSYGYSNSDVIGGDISAMGFPGTFTGTVNSSIDGTGTLNINWASFSNCVRVKSVQSAAFDLNSPLGPLSGTVDQVTYTFYNSSSKFPLFTYNYTHVFATIIDQEQVNISAQSGVFNSVKENKVKDVIFKTYPNPANNEINLHFVLAQSDNYSIEITNTLGQTVKSVSLNNLQSGMYNEPINTNDLAAGIYTIKVSGKNSQGTEKLVIQK